MVKKISAATLALLGTTFIVPPVALAMNEPMDGPYVDLLLGGAADSTQPGLAGISGTSNVGFGFAGRLGLGWNKDDYYTQFDTGYSMVDATGNGTPGSLFTLGITTGVTLTYLPVGFSVGFDFIDTYSDPKVSLGGFGGKFAINFFLSESFKLALLVEQHSYSTFAGASGPISASASGFTQLGVYAGFPIPWSIPKTPWKKPHSKLEQLPSDNTTQMEAPPAPVPDMGAPAPAPGDQPPAPPDAGTPPADAGTPPPPSADMNAAPPAAPEPAPEAAPPTAAPNDLPPPPADTAAPPATPPAGGDMSAPPALPDAAPPAPDAAPPAADVPPPPADTAAPPAPPADSAAPPAPADNAPPAAGGDALPDVPPPPPPN